MTEPTAAPAANTSARRGLFLWAAWMLASVLSGAVSGVLASRFWLLSLLLLGTVFAIPQSIALRRHVSSVSAWQMSTVVSVFGGLLVGLVVLLAFGLVNLMNGPWTMVLGAGAAGAAGAAFVAWTQYSVSGWERDGEQWAIASAIGGIFLSEAIFLWFGCLPLEGRGNAQRSWFCVAMGAAAGLGYGAPTALVLWWRSSSVAAKSTLRVLVRRVGATGEAARARFAVTLVLQIVASLAIAWGWNTVPTTQRLTSQALALLSEGMPLEEAERRLQSAPGMDRQVTCPSSNPSAVENQVFYFDGRELSRENAVWLEVATTPEGRRVSRFHLATQSDPCVETRKWSD